jgi:uncharacterized Zn-binding protein involved in type VI secretion
MIPIARLGDSTFGTCLHPSHKKGPKLFSGTIISGAPTVLVNFKPVAILGSLVLADCGHFGRVVTGATLTRAQVLTGLVARLGDTVAANPAEGLFYTGTITTASTPPGIVVTGI